MHSKLPILSLEYDRATRVALGIQIPMAGIALLLLDHGHFARLFGLVMLGFWLGAAVVAMRRPFNPSSGDILYWRYGVLPLLALAVLFDGLFH